MTTTRVPFALLSASVLLVLAGCSGGSSAPQAEKTASVAPSTQTSPSAPEPAASTDGQSKADACQIVLTSFSELGAMGGQLDTNDPQGTVTAFADFAGWMRDDFAQITNADILPAAEQASAGMDTYAAFLDDMLADPTRATEIPAQVSTMQENFMQAVTACQG